MQYVCNVYVCVCGVCDSMFACAVGRKGLCTSVCVLRVNAVVACANANEPFMFALFGIQTMYIRIRN